MTQLGFCLFDLILYVPSIIFQLNRDRSSWVEPVLSYICVLLKDHNAVMSVRLEPTASWSRVKHSTTEPLRSLHIAGFEPQLSVMLISIFRLYNNNASFSPKLYNSV